MLLIKNIEIYSPRNIGIKDILIVNEKIALIEDNIEIFSGKIKVMDGAGKRLIPGLIDNHVHIIGGGGEGSFKTRVPELTFSKLIEGGITTVVGLLGTDSITKNIENLVAKAKALKEEGLSVYVHTGSYGYPSRTLTDSVKNDITYIDEIIGVKIALSDHRAPSISYDEFARLASDVRVAGMVSGKVGIVVVHMGDGKKGLSLINKVLEDTEIPIKNIRPTHVNRKEELLVESFDFARKGGIIDLTCGICPKLSPAIVVKRAENEKVPLENITISSDGYGSWSSYDENGRVLEIGALPVNSLFNELRTMVLDLGCDLEKSLQFFTTNVSKALNIHPQKGVIEENSDGDLLIIDNDMNLVSVIANGKLMLDKGEVLVKGIYE